VRVLIFSAQYLPVIGGVERYTDGLARALVARGHQVTIVANRVPGTPWREVVSGVEVLRVPSARLLQGRYPVPLPTTECRAILRHLWKRHYDLAIVNTRFYPLSLWAVRACHAHRVPSYLVEHGSGYLSLGSPVLDRAVRVYEHAAARVARRYVGDFFGVSGQSAAWLRTFGVTARGILPNSVDPDQIRTEADAGPWDVRQRCGIAADAPLVVYVGRLMPTKGIRELVAALPEVRRAVPGTTLVIAGQGPIEAELSRYSPTVTGRADGYAVRGVVFLGLLSHAETLSLLAQADVFCLPSYSEGFSTVVLEAAALGTHVAMTPVGGASEMLPDESYGTLLPNHDPAAIAAGLIDALSHPTQRRAAARRTRDRVNSTFTWDRTAQALEHAVHGDGAVASPEPGGTARRSTKGTSDGVVC